MSEETTTGEEFYGEEFWDGRYGESEQLFSGEPNTVLVREVSELKPGRALDLGCGEGADAVWLAERGWRVTAVDISGVALGRAARQAEAKGIAADRIDWQRRDLTTYAPEGAPDSSGGYGGHGGYDLVSAQFLHSYGDFSRESILRSAVPAIAPGGVLLVVGHASFPAWEDNPHPEVHFPTAEEVLDALALPDGEWEVQLCGEHQRSQKGPDGETWTRPDNALMVRRLPR